MLDGILQPWSLNIGQQFPTPIEAIPYGPSEDCFGVDCDPDDLSDDEYRYPEGVRRVAPVFYDAE